ncbi:MAG: VCBS repeat-containing protein, partial [Pseudomonadota bacterium]
DGRADLMTATIAGMPPAEDRQVQIFLQRPDGSFPAAPDRRMEIPEYSALYDIADIKDTPGDELIFLRPDRITIVSLADEDTQRWDTVIPAPTTVAASSDERGFDRFQLVYRDFGPEPWILVPQIGAMTAMNADGTVRARLNTDRRANFFVAKPASLVSFESDIQLFLDLPKLSVGDVDGDGLADIVSATRHEIRTFLQNGDGGFPADASTSTPLNFVTEEDHLRGSGGLATTARDINNDGRLDLLISHVKGSFVSTVTSTSVFLNRDGRWNIDEPDEHFDIDKTLSSDLLLNIDNDPELELVRIQLKFTVFELIEVLLQRKLDTVIAIHELGDDGRYGEDPWSEKKLSTGISFDTFRPRGFMPRGELDMNADGYMDFVTSADGDGLEVYLGGERGPFRRREAMQKFPSPGRIVFDDINGDNLPDFVLFDPQVSATPVRIGVNTGALLPASRAGAD